MQSELFEANKKYWSNRAQGYSQVNQEELTGLQKANWLREITRQIAAVYPQQKPEELNILDVGTGPGFFAIILAEAGYQVTAVDATASMLAEAKRNSGALSETIDFRLMDAQELTFEDSSFDVVLFAQSYLGPGKTGTDLSELAKCFAPRWPAFKF